MEEKLLYDNLCKRDLSYDTKKLYTIRREELNPWFPLSGVLHISGIGMFECSGKTVTFKNINKEECSIELNSSPYSIVSSIMSLTKGELSYHDIMIILGNEISTLFNISTGRYTKLADYPDIVLEKVYPSTFYRGDGFYFFVSETKVGFKGQGMKEFVTTKLVDRNSDLGLLSYVALFAGYSITGKKVEKL